jgi:hypothetical protein
MVQGQPRQKFSETISTNKPGMVAHFYMRGRLRRLTGPMQASGKTIRTYAKK